MERFHRALSSSCAIDFSHELCEYGAYTSLTSVLSFGDVGEYACGPWGRRSVDIAIFGAQLGFCCAYFGFVAENLHSVVFSYFDCLSIDKNLIMLCMSMCP